MKKIKAHCGIGFARIAEEGGNDKQNNKISQRAFEKFKEFDGLEDRK